MWRNKHDAFEFKLDMFAQTYSTSWLSTIIFIPFEIFPCLYPIKVTGICGQRPTNNDLLVGTKISVHFRTKN